MRAIAAPARLLRRAALGGEMQPDLARPGLGLELKDADAERFAV